MKNLTPKETAEQLVNKFIPHSFHQGSIPQCFDHAKQNALICVDELMKDNAINEEIVNGGLNFQYWKEVKQEIKLL